MKKTKIVLFLIVITSVCVLARIDVVFATNKPLRLGSVMSAQELSDGSLLIADGGGIDKSLNGAQVIIINKNNDIIWRFNENLAFPHSARLFSDNSIVISDSVNNRVISVDRETKKILWSSDQWTSDSGRLSDGTHLDYPNNVEEFSDRNMLITDNLNNRLVISNRQGQVKLTIPHLNSPHNAHILSDNEIIASNTMANGAMIVDLKTKYIKPLFSGLGLSEPKDFQPLENRHILITDSNNDRILEVDQNNQIVWEYKEGLYSAQSAIRLKNGNTLIVDSFNYRLLEVTQEKQIVREIVGEFNPPYNDSLQNGDFENLSNNQTFLGWLPGTLYSSGKGKISADTKTKISGNMSARLEFEGRDVLFLTQFIKIQNNKTYNFSGWIKTDLVPAPVAQKVKGARFEFYWLDKNGRDIPKLWGYSPSVEKKTDWTKFEFPVTPPKGAVGLRLHAITLNHGTVWFDNIKFSEKGIPYWLRWNYVVLFLVGIITAIFVFKILLKKFS